jgi:undecaprenyl-diphosphatase
VTAPVTTVPPAPAAPPGLAAPPPVIFAAIRRRWPALTPVAVVVPLVLGLAAAVDRGRLLVWDGPLTDAAVAHRTAWLDDVALAVSRLGSWVVVFPVAAVLALAAARRSRTLAWVIVVTVAARPAVEWLLKDLVARPRPDGARLVPGTGYSYPSGHVLAACATWAFLSPVVSLYTHRRAIWRASVAAAGAVVALVAWSRVWLGVHWASDVVASLLLAFLALSAAEAWVDRHHDPPNRMNEARAVRSRGP